MKIIKICPICNSTFSIKPSRENKNNSGVFCCSTKCRSIAAKIKLFPCGRKQQEIVTQKSGRDRARKLYPNVLCDVCGYFPAQRHHKDGNTCNNSRENIAFLCPKHHIYADRLDHVRRISFLGGNASVKNCVRDKLGHFIKRDITLEDE